MPSLRSFANGYSTTPTPPGKQHRNVRNIAICDGEADFRSLSPRYLRPGTAIFTACGTPSRIFQVGELPRPGLSLARIGGSVLLQPEFICLPSSCFRVGDIHVSQSQAKSTRLPGALWRARIEPIRMFPSALVPLGGWFLPCRTGHPFAVSGSEEPSQKIEFVFSASPETIRREPSEFVFLRSVANRRDLAACASMILMFLPFPY
jgi:hypothetical protein